MTPYPAPQHDAYFFNLDSAKTHGAEKCVIRANRIRINISHFGPVGASAKASVTVCSDEP
jgi:hypothetical protein